MNFYVTLIFSGIMIVAFSLIWVVLDKKNVFGFTNNLENKKQELVEIINDAEQMIEELNRFSDYIVTQMDIKNEELRMNLRNADEEIKTLAQKAHSVIESVAGSSVNEEAVEYKPAAVVNGSMTESVAMPADITFRQNSGLAIESVNFDKSIYKPTYQTPRQAARKTEKVVHINNRYSEVLRLAESGLNELDIAKTLKMGKGEVGLILGINKN